MSEETNTEKKQEGDDAISKLLMLGASPAEPEMRSMTIIGDISEEISKDIIAALWYLKLTAKAEELVNPEDPECQEVHEVIRPLEILVSTNGGNADDMFAIYDAMRYIKEEVEIETFGLGKVMSAGTLILAAGTKGSDESIIVMIHPLLAVQQVRAPVGQRDERGQGYSRGLY